MHFCKEDFDIFSEADGDSCRACMYGTVRGTEVSEDDFSRYRDIFWDRLRPKFKILWSLIDSILKDNFGIHYRFNFEPKPGSRKMRSLCYTILSNEGIGQNRAQLNLRLSYDKRPNDPQRKRKFGVKFSLHHKCKEGLTNLDLPNFVHNIELFPERFISLLKELDNGFLVFKNYGKGIDDDFFAANQTELGDIDDLFLAREAGELYFQEIHRSLYWDDPADKKIIENHNMLAMWCVRMLLKLYPIYLYGRVGSDSSLTKELKSFEALRKKNRGILNCERITELREKPLDIEAGQEISIEEIFGQYVTDATNLIIGDNYIGVKNLLCQTIVELSKLVKNKAACNIRIITKEYSDLPRQTRKRMPESEFDYRLENLVRRIVALGFKRDRIILKFGDMRERKLETDLWEIKSGHPLDFYKRPWVAMKNNLLFKPKRTIICR